MVVARDKCTLLEGIIRPGKIPALKDRKEYKEIKVGLGYVGNTRVITKTKEKKIRKYLKQKLLCVHAKL